MKKKYRFVYNFSNGVGVADLGVEYDPFTIDGLNKITEHILNMPINNDVEKLSITNIIPLND